MTTKKISPQTKGLDNHDQIDLKAKPAAKAKKARGHMPDASRVKVAELGDETEMAVSPIMPPPRETKFRRLRLRLEYRETGSEPARAGASAQPHPHNPRKQRKNSAEAGP